MAEQATNRCPRCGSPLYEDERCCSELCPSNRETDRPRPSQAEGVRMPPPSGAFAVQESARTTLRNLVKTVPESPVEIPSQPKLPSFPENDLDSCAANGPPRRD